MNTKLFMFHKVDTRLAFLFLGLALLLILTLYSTESFALAGGDTLDELKNVKATTEKATKTFAYLIGCVSGVVGATKFVMTQNFATAAVAGAISIAAFKFPALVTATAII